MRNLDMKTVDNVISIALIITCSVDIILRLRDIFRKPKEPQIPDFSKDYEEDDEVYIDSCDIDFTEDDEWDIK